MSLPCRRRRRRRCRVGLVGVLVLRAVSELAVVLVVVVVAAFGGGRVPMPVAGSGSRARPLEQNETRLMVCARPDRSRAKLACQSDKSTSDNMNDELTGLDLSQLKFASHPGNLDRPDGRLLGRAKQSPVNLLSTIWRKPISASKKLPGPPSTRNFPSPRQL